MPPNRIYTCFALDLATGAMKYNSPRMITYTFPSGIAETNAGTWLQRAGLLLFNNVLYVGTANVLENPLDWRTQEGFLQIFQSDDLSVLLDSFETTPTGQGGGFWQAGRGIAADASGNVLSHWTAELTAPYVAGRFHREVQLGNAVAPQLVHTRHWALPLSTKFGPERQRRDSDTGNKSGFCRGKAGVIYLLDQTN